MNIKPLDRFPFVGTTDVDEKREAIAKTHGNNKLQLHRSAEGFHARGNRRVLRNVVLSYATFGAVVDQEFSAFTGFAQGFRIRGSSEILVDRAWSKVICCLAILLHLLMADYAEAQRGGGGRAGAGSQAGVGGGRANAGAGAAGVGRGRRRGRRCRRRPRRCGRCWRRAAGVGAVGVGNTNISNTNVVRGGAYAGGYPVAAAATPYYNPYAAAAVTTAAVAYSASRPPRVFDRSGRPALFGKPDCGERCSLLPMWLDVVHPELRRRKRRVRRHRPTGLIKADEAVPKRTAFLFRASFCVALLSCILLLAGHAKRSIPLSAPSRYWCRSLNCFDGNWNVAM